MWGPRSIAKLVNITPTSLWFMVRKLLLLTGFINQQTLNITGGAHIVEMGKSMVI